jgi:hypothetical protein
MAIFKANANLKETADGTHWVMFNAMYRSLYNNQGLCEE